MALEDQMEMSFGNKGIDPISGNEVPTGSLPEEVRDDIPAQLSEGEYVVPADVVRYYGVKFFEDLRMQAKTGFDDMAANGRIGGDPIEGEEDLDIDLSMEDLEVVQGMDDGGDVSKEPKFKNRYEKIMYYLSQLMKEKEEEESKLKGPSIAEQINFGGKFDEGGDVFAQKGGFDMSEAGNAAQGVTATSAFEARTYMNDAGHKIIIMFLNGEPVTPIPDGYYPVGDTVTGTTQAQPSSGGGGGGGGTSAAAPTPINYKELSLDELKEMVNGQKSLGSKLIGATVFGKIAMWDQTRRVKEEIERRIDDPATTGVNKMRLENLLDLSNREEPGLVKTIFDKVTGKELSTLASQIPKPKTSDVDYADPTMAGGSPYVPGGGNPYTPEVTQSDAGLDPEILQKVEAASQAAADSAFGGDTYDEVPVNPTSNTPTPFTPSRQTIDQQRRKDRQSKSSNLQGKSTRNKTNTAKVATRGLSKEEKTGGAGLDTRFGMSGLNKGGLMKNKNKKSK